MEEEIKGWGGPRPNSGRHKIKDKKKPLTVYVRSSIIKRKGEKKLKEAFIELAEG
jgi:hypothetical protein